MMRRRAERRAAERAARKASRPSSVFGLTPDADPRLRRGINSALAWLDRYGPPAADLSSIVLMADDVGPPVVVPAAPFLAELCARGEPHTAAAIARCSSRSWLACVVTYGVDRYFVAPVVWPRLSPGGAA